MLISVSSIDTERRLTADDDCRSCCDAGNIGERLLDDDCAAPAGHDGSSRRLVFGVTGIMNDIALVRDSACERKEASARLFVVKESRVYLGNAASTAAIPARNGVLCPIPSPWVASMNDTNCKRRKEPTSSTEQSSCEL